MKSIQNIINTGFFCLFVFVFVFVFLLQRISFSCKDTHTHTHTHVHSWYNVYTCICHEEVIRKMKDIPQLTVNVE